MSTKCSLVSGDKFHLFEESFDLAHNVWLDLDGCRFEATPHGLRIEIPLAIWETIRQHSPANFDLARLTDAQLKADAGKRVDERRAEYRAARAAEQAKPRDARRKPRIKSRLSFISYNARLPRAEHLSLVLEKLRAERTAQRKLQRDIAQLSVRPKA
jgi:hypothetical protein